MIFYYKNKISKKYREIEQCQEILNKLQTRFNQLNVSTINAPIKYDVDWSIAKKAQFMLNKHKHAATTRRIGNFILTADKARGKIYDERQFIVNLSATLNTYHKKQLVFRRVRYPNDNVVFYALKIWMDENDKLKSQYNP